MSEQNLVLPANLELGRNRMERKGYGHNSIYNVLYFVNQIEVERDTNLTVVKLLPKDSMASMVPL